VEIKNQAYLFLGGPANMQWLVLPLTVECVEVPAYICSKKASCPKAFAIYQHMAYRDESDGESWETYEFVRMSE